MRKLSALFLSAVLALSATGCELKKSDSEPPEDVETVTETETDTDTPADSETESPDADGKKETSEPVFREYSEDDFSSIKLNINETDAAPPVDIKSVEPGKMSFGERMSPCKAEDVYQNYGSYLYAGGDESVQNTDDTRYQRALEICSKPCSGNIVDIVYLDGYFYMSVNFDDYCSLHDSSLFRYDPETSKYEEVDTRTGLDYHGCYNALCGYCGKLYYTDLRVSQDEPCNIYSYDVKTGETAEISHIDKNIAYLIPTENGLYSESYVFDTERQDYSMEYDVIDYDTGNTIAVSEGLFGREGDRMRFFCEGEPVRVTGGYDGFEYKPVTVTTKYYKISTDLEQYIDIFAWKDRLCILNSESIENGSAKPCLYTYDLKTMERTVIDFSEYNQGIRKKSGDGIFICSQDKYEWGKSEFTLFYLMPQYGTIFKIDSGIENPYDGQSADAPYIMSMEERYGEDEFDDYYWVPKKIYWVN